MIFFHQEWILGNAWPYPVDQSPLPADTAAATLHSGAVVPPTGGFFAPAPEYWDPVFGNIYCQPGLHQLLLVNLQLV